MKASLCILVAAGFLGTASGGPIGFTSLATASVGFSLNGGTGFVPPDQIQSDPYSASVTAWATFSYQGFTEPIMGSADAKVSVGFGYFDLSVTQTSGDFTDGEGGPRSIAHATASASFADAITILGGTGTANLVWFLSNVTSSTSGFPPVVNPVSYDLPSQATFGVPFDISASDAIQAPNSLFLGGGAASVAFSIWGLSVNGSFQNYQYNTGSDASYLSGTFIEAPEPAYTWLIAGLMLVALVAKKIKSEFQRRR